MPSDLNLFPDLKDQVRGRHKFTDYHDIICTGNGCLEEQEQLVFYNRIRALENHWTKCMSLGRDMVKK